MSRTAKSIRLVFKNTVPEKLYTERMDAVDELPPSQRDDPRVIGREVVMAWRDQLIGAFNKWAFGLEMAVVIFCFGASSLPAAQAIEIAAVLCALSARDIYSFPFMRRKCNEKTQYFLESAMDAVVCGLFLLAAEVLMLFVTPDLAVAKPALYHGMLACLPIIAILRAYFRPMPGGPMKFDASQTTANKIYYRIWVLNILWMGTFNGVVSFSANGKPGSAWDFFRGMLTLVTFMTWVAVQRVAIRRLKFTTALADLKKEERERLAGRLPAGLTDKQPMYGWYVALERLIYLQIALAIGTVLWPWVRGASEAPSVGKLIGMIACFAACLLGWRFVKKSNQAAARALAG